MFITQKLAGQTVAHVLAGQNLTEALNAVWRSNPNLESGQRGAIQDICYGTLRQLGLIEGILKQLLRSPLHEAELKALLLIAVYQLQFTRAASHTIVDHAVKVAAQTGSGFGKGLVNGVLRSFLRGKDELVRRAQANEVGLYSHPAWWIKTMKSAYPTEWEAILNANNQHPPMTLRVNPAHTTVNDYLALLTAANIEAIALDDSAISLKRPVSVDFLPHFFAGWVSVQDWGAQVAAKLLDLHDGQTVLDACAAPGGKTCHILETANVTLTALDNDATRLQRVKDNLNRINKTATLLQGDASAPDTWYDGQQFDRILADVPCSATGVTRRHPDIKWLRRNDDLAKFARQQAKILDALWPLVAPNGKLLYATCSVFPIENAASAEAFALRHPDAKRLELPASALPNGQSLDGQLLPTAEHDGFYYALFSKS
ncbi:MULTISPECIES: 16S rRNA (cytosine(967)-C(5))-methyltransferase RsmB [Deefgea]|uniref:16S rRNA (cytosine(967)-C(5))-methyltransferase n=1 Tax=Deefgea piscis TaxID=2739061 RepID=A0A6M8SR39_9NEIS|nr:MULTISPECIES: 16S rRNA (cytosine(967)-C(5))-methyltransferase RsmB [Deefgea]MBM5573338.1 16S rRNA (cytosine(967)-C(5))-methyltransferase RsmB [Deefgea sp. CFH1-16]QKJ67131.1 16S rRNA (cytosine(967)-C(5))-methyltransferase RsmB [Deefgea piscis]